MIVYTMPKSRIMSAGTVGTSKRIRVNGPEGGGNKLQGLPPICNMRSPLVPYVRTRADGENRNVVFCINQLSGGVGAKRGQFGPGNRAGVGQTGGCAKPTPPWWYNNQAILAALQILSQYQQTLPERSINLVGAQEDLKSDHIITHPDHNGGDDAWAFDKLVSTGDMDANLVSAINLINSLGLQYEVNGKMELHTLGIVGDAASLALKSKNYGLPVRFGTYGPVIVAFGDSIRCANSSGPCKGSSTSAGFSCTDCTNQLFGGCTGFCEINDGTDNCNAECLAKETWSNPDTWWG